jgi:hypothetical protein
VVRHLSAAAAAAVCRLQDYCCLSSLRSLRRLEMFHDWPPASGDIRDGAWLAVRYCTVSFVDCCTWRVRRGEKCIPIGVNERLIGADRHF